MNRINKDRYYLDIAYEVAKRSTCLRRQYGAVIVKNDEIISTGYNGAPRGVVNCSDRGRCLREEMGIEHGTGYELCKSVHAEQNAIISAKRSDMIGATLYLAGFQNGEKITGIPCSICKRFIINSGIGEVVSEYQYPYDLEETKSSSLCPNKSYIVAYESPITHTPVNEYVKELSTYGKNN